MRYKIGIFTLIAISLYGFMHKQTFGIGQVSANKIDNDTHNQLAHYQQKNFKTNAALAQSLSQQLFWEQEKKKLEDQPYLETTEAMIIRLQKQLEEGRKRWDDRNNNKKNKKSTR